jgi:thioredoxin-related protein
MKTLTLAILLVLFIGCKEKSGITDPTSDQSGKVICVFQDTLKYSQNNITVYNLNWLVINQTSSFVDSVKLRYAESQLGNTIIIKHLYMAQLNINGNKPLHTGLGTVEVEAIMIGGVWQ